MQFLEIGLLSVYQIRRNKRKQFLFFSIACRARQNKLNDIASKVLIRIHENG